MTTKKKLKLKTVDDQILTDEEAKQTAKMLCRWAGVKPTDDEETAVKKLQKYFHKNKNLSRRDVTTTKKITESREMEALIRRQLKDIMKGIKDEGCLEIFTHDDTPMLLAILNAALESQSIMDAVTKQMLDINWVTGPVV